MDAHAHEHAERGIQTRGEGSRHAIAERGGDDAATLKRVRGVPTADDHAGALDPIDAVANEDDAAAASVWMGRTIGQRYRIVRHVASGGMGHVFLAQHVTLGGYVAIKILLEGSDENAARYFRNEARILSRLRHPNLVSVFDCATTHSGGCYMIMEWLPGDDLGTFLGTYGTLPPKRALWVLAQLASAIDYVHSQGIVHRDIKPENVIVCPGAYDLVKLLDFGVAIPFRAPPKSERSKLIGTPLYMAPEQASGGPASPSTDLYALGALALELLAGSAPYARLSVAEIVSAVLTTQPSRPSDSGVHVLGLDPVIARALARDPRDRFPSGHAFVLALRDVLRGGDRRRGSTTPKGRPSPRVPPRLKSTVVLPASA